MARYNQLKEKKESTKKMETFLFQKDTTICWNICDVITFQRIMGKRIKRRIKVVLNAITMDDVMQITH